MHVPIIPDGVYKGTFQRQTMTENKSTDVTIRFSDSTFQVVEAGIAGYSGTRAYPVIGTGTYSALDKGLRFVQSGYFTADFDWTIILWGDYKANLSGKDIEIWRDYNDGNKVKDVYELTRQ